MSEEYSLEIVNPEKSFLLKDDVTEVVVPAYEGEIGILKDHISIISFLKPGIVKVFSKSGEDSYYVNDGIIEFKNNNLSILTSLILDLKDIDKEKILEIKKSAEKELNKSEINDQEKYLLDLAFASGKVPNQAKKEHFDKLNKHYTQSQITIILFWMKLEKQK